MTETETTTSILEQSGAHTDEQESVYAAGLMLALDRLFKIGPFYPPGHSACRRVTTQFQQELRDFLDGASSLVFRMENERLLVQDRPVDAKLPGVEDFENLLHLLGVDHLEISEDASVEDVHIFVKRFLAFRNEVSGAKKFQQMEFDGLPPTVNLGHRHFATGIQIHSCGPEGAAKTDDATPDAPDAPGADGVSDAAADDESAAGAPGATGAAGDAAQPGTGGLDIEDPDAENHRITATPPRLADDKRPVAEGLGRLVTRLDEGGRSELRSRALESVEMMIRNLGRNMAEGENDILGDFLKKIPQVGEKRNRTDGDAAAAPPAGDRPERPAYEMSMADLRRALAGYASQAKEQIQPDELDNAENLSVLLQLLNCKQLPPVLDNVRRRLDRVLAVPLQPHEREILLAGVRRLIQGECEAHCPRAMRLIAAVMRRAPGESAIRFYSDLCRSCTTEELGRAWPYAVNEVLKGNDSGDPVLFLALCRRLASLPMKAMLEKVELLRGMGAVKKELFSDDVVMPPVTELYPVFSCLLQASHPGPLASKLVKGLKLEPPVGIGEAVLPVIADYRHSYRTFLVELLAQDPAADPSPALLEAGGKILSTDLRTMNPLRRKEAWVPETIAALAEYPVPDAEDLLRWIRKRRFLFLLPTWNKECRNAAGRALKQLKKKRAAARAAAAQSEEPSTHDA